MWFDFSPMRIDEFMRQDAKLWNESLTLRNAGNKGRQAAASEGTARQAMQPPEKPGRWR